MAGYAINYLTPTASLGGEVTKAALLAAHRSGAAGASGVIVGKVAFALAHLAFVSLGALLVLWRLPLPRALWLAMLSCGLLVGSGIVLFFWLQIRGQIGAVFRWFTRRNLGGKWMRRAAALLTNADEALKEFYAEQPLGLLWAVAWHLAGFSIGIFQTWLFFWLLDAQSSWLIAAGMWFLGMWFDLLTFAVPMNLGSLEGTRIIAFKSLGYTSLMGMTYGLALRLAQLFWAAIGLLLYARQSAAGPDRIQTTSDSHSPSTHPSTNTKRRNSDSKTEFRLLTGSPTLPEPPDQRV
jgi:hypothetical protein